MTYRLNNISNTRIFINDILDFNKFKDSCIAVGWIEVLP